MRALYEYNAWANHRCLGAAECLSPEQFTKPLGSSFSSVRDTLTHIYGGEWIWLDRFQGHSSMGLPEASQFPTLSSLRTRWAENETKLMNFVAALTEEDLNRVLEYKSLKLEVFRNPLWQSMQHLVNHGSYHRGQVTTLLRQLGAPAIATDLMHFYRERSATASA
jgi:uncharacterized damage-inducible protein DinB